MSAHVSLDEGPNGWAIEVTGVDDRTVRIETEGDAIHVDVSEEPALVVTLDTPNPA